jgi:hypothetical protein
MFSTTITDRAHSIYFRKCTHVRKCRLKMSSECVLCLCVCVCVCMCVCVCVCVCVYALIVYLYAYICTCMHRQTDRQNMHTETDRHTHTNTQTHTQTYARTWLVGEWSASWSGPGNLIQQNVFSYNRMCSLTIECVLLQQNVFSYNIWMKCLMVWSR